MNRHQRRSAKSQSGSQQPGSVPSVQGTYEDATRHHQAGRLAEAERLYRQILAVDPRHADSLNALGLVAYQTGRLTSAAELIGEAARIRGDVASFHINLGAVLKAQGKFGEAVACYERALAVKPDDAEAHNNLGNALVAQGKLVDAVACYKRALALKPDLADAHMNLGAVFKDQGKFSDAVACHERALALKPDFAEAYINLGAVFADQGKLNHAVACYGRALALKPDYAVAHMNLGNALVAQGKLDDGVACHERALALRPDYAEAHSNLGNALVAQGKLDDAVARYERALALKPDFAVAHSSLLFSMIYNSSLPAELIDAESRRWNERHGLAHRPAAHGYVNDRDSVRRLRVGYVSPDFRRHSVSYFLEPLLRAHDPAAVEVFCYAEVPVPDAVTDRLRGLADQWRVTVGMSDDELAQRILTDRIDILVDLAGHTRGNRLLVFARKPAPVQITWLGYPHTTSLTAIDYRLVDAVTDPEGACESWASERLVRLERGFLCYGPPADAPEPAPPPSLASGAITFGSLNNLSKLSPATLDAWAALLRRLANARLLLKGSTPADAASMRALFRARFAERGVAPERVDLVGYERQTADHLAVYHRIDIALDPFSYNGTTTTCEALWMGVPVVTMRGTDRHASRVGASLLGRVGLDALIASDVAEYIEIAAQLAADRDRLIGLRRTLRDRMATSSLCDAPAFARQIEAAYRDMWQQWCERTK